MLDHLKKTLGLEKPEAIAASTEHAEMVASLTSKLDASESFVKELASKVEELTAALSSANEIVALANAEKQEAIESAFNQKMNARKDRIVMSVGTDKADAFFGATKSLADADFDAIVGAVDNTFKTEASSAMFKESGVTAEVVVANVEEKSALEKALKQKYSASK